MASSLLPFCVRVCLDFFSFFQLFLMLVTQFTTTLHIFTKPSQLLLGNSNQLEVLQTNFAKPELGLSLEITGLQLREAGETTGDFGNRPMRNDLYQHHII